MEGRSMRQILLMICLAAAVRPAGAQVVIGQLNPAGAVATFYADPAASPAMTQDEMIGRLRQKVKYVFVLFQENRSFDHYFGTFPGANGLFSDGQKPRSAADTPGFTQSYMDVDGKPATVTPFLLGQAQHAADLDDIDHGHPRMAAKMDLVGGVPKMDRFASVEQLKYLPAGATTGPTPAASLKAKQFGELVMAYVDCDTVPFLWNYANRFTLFDNIFQTTIGPSTPNAIAMIAGQSGETQWVEHPDKAGTGIPVVGDPVPFWGSAMDKTDGARQPANPARENGGVNGANTSPNLTFASLPLTLAGKQLSGMTETDTQPADLADVQQDVPFITGLGRPAFAWRWYEEGYDHEPNEAGDAATHASYIGHHNGAQYFGYVSNNPALSQNLRGLGDFFADMKAGALPADGGVFYVRGGYTNIDGLKPAFNAAAFPGNAEAAAVEQRFLGDDDHPAYSDSEISEALVARAVNAIARSPYWGQSVTIITYDESEGDYDHVPPRILSFDPAGLPLSRGPRIPLIVISPYSQVHAVSREEGDHNSVIALINTLFNLPPLADLPDELAARVKGGDPAFATGTFSDGGKTQSNLGPHDDRTPGMGALLSAFDPARLRGDAPALPPNYAEIPDTAVLTLPHFGGGGCVALGITPVDKAQGITTVIPADFNPRPMTFPR